MANRNYPQSKIWSNHLLPAALDVSVAIGATGAPTIEAGAGNGKGIASIIRLAAGQYRIRLTDNYALLNQFSGTMQSALSGTPVAATALSAGTIYQIVSLGTTTQAQWVTAGVPSGVTAAPGVVFLAAATSSGTGSAQTLVSSGINSVELMGNVSQMLNNQPYNNNLGAHVYFQTMGPTAAGNTAPIAKDPVNGSKIQLRLQLNSSQVQ